MLRGHTDNIFCVTFSPDSKILATCGRDATVRLLDFEAGKLLVSLVPGGDIRALAFSPDGTRLAASTLAGITKVWEINNGAEELAREVADHRLHLERVSCLRFSPDNQTLAVGCTDGSLRIWQTLNGDEERRFHAHSGSVLDVAFLPDGRKLVSGGDDRLVKCWDLTTDPEPTVLGAHSTQISAVDFSPDGKKLALAGSMNHHHIGAGQKTLNIWDCANRSLTHELAGHAGWLTSVAYSPAGNRIVSGDDTGVAIL